jgi:hypothetical protein
MLWSTCWFLLWFLSFLGNKILIDPFDHEWDREETNHCTGHALIRPRERRITGGKQRPAKKKEHDIDWELAV